MLICSWSYTCVWNSIDYPATIVPLTKVDPEIDLKGRSYQEKNVEDEFIYETCTILYS